MKVFSKPVICSAFMGVCTLLSYNVMYNVTSSNAVSVVIALVVALITYFVPYMFITKTIRLLNL